MQTPSNYITAKKHRQNVESIKRSIKDYILIAGGVLAASFGLKSFLLTNHFIDGGVTGISLLINALTNWPLSLLIVIINTPFVILGYITVGKGFALRTTIAITTLSLCLALIPFPFVTNDKLLVAVFGGIFLGAGIGLTMRGGGVIDGTEVLAVYLSKRLNVTIGDFILIVNVFIFGLASTLLSVESALYSMITYFAATKTLDVIIEGYDEYIGVTIISPHCDKIRHMIVNTMGRGLTVYNGKRGVGKTGEVKDVDIIYTVITRLEMNKLNAEIEKISPNAFVVMHSVKDTKGGMIKKKRFKH